MTRIIDQPRLCLSIIFLIASTIALAFLFPSRPYAQRLPRDQWGAVPVSVSHTNGKWIIAGTKNKVTVDDAALTISIQAGTTQWALVPSAATEMLVKSKGEEFPLRLADAQKISIVPYDLGFKAGVKINLSNWRHNSGNLDLTLFLTVCLEGHDEDLVFDVSTREQETVLRQLDWPAALDARSVDYTLLSNGRGTLLPRDWPKEYYPIRSITPAGKIATTDHSLLQSHVIESWSMSWWGFQKGKSAMMLIVETPMMRPTSFDIQPEARQ